MKKTPKKTQPISTPVNNVVTGDFDFKGALAYLQAKGHKINMHDFRKEVKFHPERFPGMFRRNSLAKRGRGGKYYFMKWGLDQYQSLTPVS
jgi:hypothetical protein